MTHPEPNSSYAGPRSWERYVQTIIGAIIIAGISWCAWAIAEVRKDVAVSTEKLNNLQIFVSTATLDRYTSIEAGADKAIANARMLEIERQVAVMRERIDNYCTPLRDMPPRP